VNIVVAYLIGGLFVSLICRRVLIAVTLAFVLGTFLSPESPEYWCILGGLAACLYPLTRFWVTHRQSGTSTLAPANVWPWGGNSSAALPVSQAVSAVTIHSPTLSHDSPVPHATFPRSPAPRSLSTWLREEVRQWRLSAPGWIAFRRLAWLETTHMVWDVVPMVVGCGILSWWVTYLPTVGTKPSDGLVAFALHSWKLILLVAGIRSFQSGAAFQQQRFAAERGISPGLVWLSKHAVWLGLTLLLVVLLTAWAPVKTALLGMHFPYWLFLLQLMMIYAVGQLLSMLLRSSLLAICIAAAVLLFLGIMFEFLTLLGSSTVGGALLLLGALFLASFCHAGHWVLERSTRRSWVRLTLLLVLPLLFIGGNFVRHRIQDVPRVAAPFHTATYWAAPPPEAAATAALYREAERAMAATARTMPVPRQQEASERTAFDGWVHATADERQSLQRNREARDLLHQAVARPDCVLWTSVESYRDLELRSIFQLRKLLLLEARQLEADGELEQALARYVSVVRMARHYASHGDEYIYHNSLLGMDYSLKWMDHWLTRPGQTVELLQTASRQLSEELQKFPRWSETIPATYFQGRPWAVAGKVELHSHQTPPVMAFFLGLLDTYARHAPWERTRRIRLWDARTVIAQVEANSLENQLAVQNARLSWPITSADQQRIDRDIANTPLFPDQEDWRNWRVIATQAELTRRLLTLKLALVASRVKSQKLPERLVDLYPEFLHRLPLDPWTGQPFGYEPVGMTADTGIFRSGYDEPAETGPLLWTANGSEQTPVPVSRNPQTGRTRYALGGVVDSEHIAGEIYYVKIPEP